MSPITSIATCLFHEASEDDLVHKLPQEFLARRFKPEYRLRGRVGI
jgi:hypothetical protein